MGNLHIWKYKVKLPGPEKTSTSEVEQCCAIEEKAQIVCDK